jgi:hypothetical protein
MSPRRHVHLLMAIGLVAGLLLGTIGTVIEAMSAGSIQGQEGWSGGTIAISPSTRPSITPVSTNAPGWGPGGSRTTPHWATTTGTSPPGCSDRASRCPLASRHPEPVRAFGVASGGLTEVANFFASDPAFPGGVTVAAGDLTGDGVAEIITGAGPGGGPHVRAFSVAGGVATEVASLYAYDPAFPGGVTVAATDLTGDIITGVGPGGGPHVRVLDVSGLTLK